MSDLHNKEVAIEFYEHRYEEGYMEEWDDLKKNKVREVLKSIGLPQKGKALDFGCGNGVFTNIMKNILPEWEVYGVEISKIAIQNASNKFPGCHFFIADETKNHEHQFDFLFSHHVIEHVQDVDETFTFINNYLKPSSSQLHILPCGNAGSFEYEICRLKKNGIEKEKGNRFFFEEPGHLQRLTTTEFSHYESKIGFTLQKEFYSNQYDGAIDWITKSSPRFVKRLTSTDDAVDDSSFHKLLLLRKKLLPMTYRQFAYSKYWEIKSKWNKKLKDYLALSMLYIPAMLAKLFYYSVQQKAVNEWAVRKSDKNGSEMFLFFTRKP
ncbi:MAG TPA: class I SAM-dependent methyltransferase [Chitinophagaceae bacterium]